jgi:hypothetical protein
VSPFSGRTWTCRNPPDYLAELGTLFSDQREQSPARSRDASMRVKPAVEGMTD